MTRRTDQVNELLRAEIAELVQSELRDPRIGGLVSITQVDVSPDFRKALVFVSVLGSEEERRSTMAALDHARPFLRRELSKRVSLRNTPDVSFVSDTSIERAQELTDLMRRTAQERGEAL